jgi:hypothetical protein
MLPRSRTGRRPPMRSRSSVIARPAQCMLWISATNPAVSLPNLPRIRKILANPELFIVVQDAFMTETAQLRTSCCQLHCGAKRPVVSPTQIARFTFPARRSSRRARQKAILKFFSISPAAWIFATGMADRWSNGAHLKKRSRLGRRARAVGRVTIPD